jgi:predicted NAD/FAD-dependent oxidoreductase
MSSRQRIAIVGAGMAGLSAAGELAKRGYEVVVFEKSRGPGGRSCSRRREGGSFDHGAPFFEVRSPAFTGAVRRWHLHGIVVQWDGDFGVARGGGIQREHHSDERWVGQPKMSSIGRYLASGLNLHVSTRIISLSGDPGAWVLTDGAGTEHGPFDWVVLSCPGPQARTLLPEACPLAEEASHMRYSTTWVAMLEFEDPLDLEWDAIRFIRGTLGAAYRNSSKPERGAQERWVLHADSQWSAIHQERSQHWVGAALSESFSSWTGASPSFVSAHRWLYAQSQLRGIRLAMADSQWQLGLCGDGLAGSGLDAAWSSGVTMAEDIHLSQRSKASHH